MWEQGNYLISASDFQRAGIPNVPMSVGRSPTHGTTTLRSCQKLVHNGVFFACKNSEAWMCFLDIEFKRKQEKYIETGQGNSSPQLLQ